MKYVIEYGESVTEVEKKVNDRLQHGYVPLGGIVIALTVIYQVLLQIDQDAASTPLGSALSGQDQPS